MINDEFSKEERLRNIKEIDKQIESLFNYRAMLKYSPYDSKTDMLDNTCIMKLNTMGDYLVENYPEFISLLASK